MDQIRIDSLELACIVGVRPRERRQKQIVRVDLTLWLDLSVAGRSGRIAHTCDYSRVTDEVAALLQFREYQLIEVATEEIAAMLLTVHRNIQRVTIQLEKPAALNGRARTAAVHVERERGHFSERRRATPYGERVTVLETHEAGLYSFELDPGCSLVFSGTPVQRRLEWLVSGELRRGDLRAEESELLTTAGAGAPVTNVGERRAALFACITPALDQPEPHKSG